MLCVSYISRILQGTRMNRQLCKANKPCDNCMMRKNFTLWTICWADRPKSCRVIKAVDCQQKAPQIPIYLKCFLRYFIHFRLSLGAVGRSPPKLVCINYKLWCLIACWSAMCCMSSAKSKCVSLPYSKLIAYCVFHRLIMKKIQDNQ